MGLAARVHELGSDEALVLGYYLEESNICHDKECGCRHMSLSPLSDEALDTQFPDFIRQVRGRLDQGRREYGDSSLQRSPADLLGELAEECLDIAGWGFILWARIERILSAMPSGVRADAPVAVRRLEMP